MYKSKKGCLHFFRLFLCWVYLLRPLIPPVGVCSIPGPAVICSTSEKCVLCAVQLVALRRNGGHNVRCQWNEGSRKEGIWGVRVFFPHFCSCGFSADGYAADQGQENSPGSPYPFLCVIFACLHPRARNEEQDYALRKNRTKSFWNSRNKCGGWLLNLVTYTSLLNAVGAVLVGPVGSGGL